MLTLDALATMARHMAGRGAGPGPGPGAYRDAEAGARLRRVTLPPAEEEARRARGLFGLAVAVGALVIPPVGVLAVHLGDLMAGHLPAASLLRTGGWLLGATLLFIVPYSAIGLWREVRRYRRVRDALGDEAYLDASGVLRSEDGRRRYRLR